MHLPNVGHVRTDPILDQQCLSGHVHTFYGAKSLWPNTSPQDLHDIDPYQVSGNIKENKSMYWHPSVYRILPDGTYELQETRLGVYYIWDPNDSNVQAFPPGFSMIAGGVNKYNSKAELNFECEGEGIQSSSTFPTEPCPGSDGEFFIEFKMPNCWNGQPRDNNDSHVTYSNNGGNEVSDPCPSGYNKIPQLWLFLEFVNGYKGGNHVFADGQQVLHVDFFSGWDEQVLKDAIVNCKENSDEFNPIGGTRCSQFTYINDELNLGEDANYDPQPFDTTLITDEIITGIPSLVMGSPKNGDGTCNANDKPKQGGNNPTPTTPTATPTSGPTLVSTVGPTSSPNTPTSSPTGSPVDTPVDYDTCISNCRSDYRKCDRKVDVLCHDNIFMVECVTDCEEMHVGDEFEITECIDNECVCVEAWCVEKQDLCYEEQDHLCLKARRQCKKACDEV